jgi:ribosomal biogenesis protein LAS1
MSVYISSPSCPAFLHLLHSLIGALLLPYPPTSAAEAGTARMSYAMAVVRFVNGMVDPLQTGKCKVYRNGTG